MDPVHRPDPRENLICRCYRVTEAEILDAIRSNSLHTVEEVTAATNAAGGCSSCYDDVQGLLDRVRGRQSTRALPPVLTNPEKRTMVMTVLQEAVEPLYRLNAVEIQVMDVRGSEVLARYRGPTVGTTKPSILTLKWFFVKSMSDACRERMQLIELNMLDRGIAEDPA
jgi:NifU-like protein